MDTDRLEQIEEAFKKRYKQKKLFNLMICTVIFLSGITALILIWNLDQEGPLTFRWMTVDGTIFTTAIAFFYVLVNIREITQYTELTNRIVYFTRLASATAESLIFLVVMMSQLPVFPQHMHILRFDMFLMHVLIPILTVESFLVNDSPVGKLKLPKLLHGTWFITFYASIVLTLIAKGIITTEMVPYFFLDIVNLPPLAFAGYFVIIYCISFCLSCGLYEANRRLSWLWFRGVARRS